MLDRVRRVVASPVFADDDEKTRVAGMLNTILLAALVIQAISSATAPWSDPDPLPTWVINGVLAGVEILLLILIRRGYVRFTSLVLLSVLWTAVTLITISYGGVGGPGPANFGVLIIVAGLLLGGRAAAVCAGLSALVVLGGLYAQTNGLIEIDPSLNTPAAMASTLVADFILVAALLYLATRSLGRAIERARRNERVQAEANRDLQALRTSLEEQVAQRTRDLERHTAYIQASAEVGQAITSVLDPEALLRQVVELIHRRFVLYQVAAFMLDESGRWAEFRAGTGEVGLLLQKRGLRLEVDGASTIGWCIANARTRVEQNVRPETCWLDHPLFDEVRSEAALPLIARGRVIGALSAYSSQEETFDPDTVGVLQALVAQVAVALDNTRLFAESQSALEAERRAYGDVGRKVWNELLRGQVTPGYSYDGARLSPASEMPPPELDAVVREGQSVILQNPGGPVFALPIKVRGQVIGVVDAQKGSQGEAWTSDDVALLETLVDQLGLALDNARLYQDTQRRAARERLTGEITARIRESLDVDVVLQTAVQEMREVLGLAEAEVWVGTGLASGVGGNGDGPGGGTGPGQGESG